MIEKNLHVNIWMRVCVCLEERNSFQVKKKKKAIKWNTNIFSQLNPLAIQFGHFCRRTM